MAEKKETEEKRSEKDIAARAVEAGLGSEVLKKGKRVEIEDDDDDQETGSGKG